MMELRELLATLASLPRTPDAIRGLLDLVSAADEEDLGRIGKALADQTDPSLRQCALHPDSTAMHASLAALAEFKPGTDDGDAYAVELEFSELLDARDRWARRQHALRRLGREEAAELVEAELAGLDASIRSEGELLSSVAWRKAEALAARTRPERSAWAWVRDAQCDDDDDAVDEFTPDIGLTQLADHAAGLLSGDAERAVVRALERSPELCERLADLLEEYQEFRTLVPAPGGHLTLRLDRRTQSHHELTDEHAAGPPASWSPGRWRPNEADVPREERLAGGGDRPPGGAPPPESKAWVFDSSAELYAQPAGERWLVTVYADPEDAHISPTLDLWRDDDRVVALVRPGRVRVQVGAEIAVLELGPP